MSGYRDKPSFWQPPDDRWTFPFIAARLGFGLVAIGLGIVLTGGPPISGGIAALVGTALLAFGLRNY